LTVSSSLFFPSMRVWYADSLWHILQDLALIAF
jgi:hypothetical protein